MAVDCPALCNVLVLIDTPGICDPGAQTERALRAIVSADLVVLVLNATQLLTENERVLAVDWMSQGLGKPIVPVLNWMNAVEERDRAELRQLLDRWSLAHLGGELGRYWFEVNAKAALMHVVGGGPAPTDDFFALRSALSGLRRDHRQGLQTRSRLSQLRADVAVARRANLDVLHRIRRNAEQVEREREATHHDLRLLINRFDANARLKRAALINDAAETLDSKLERLVDFWFKGESKESLEANANHWYQMMLGEGVEQVESEAERALLGLTGDDLRCAEPMTIKEHLILKSRLQVGELHPTGVSDGAVVTSAWAGGLLGQALIPIPVVGFLAGLWAGGWLAERFGQQQSDSITAYSEYAREAWKTAAADVMRLLQAQFDARAAIRKEQIVQWLEQSHAVAAGTGGEGLATELLKRDATEAALGRCEALLQTA